MANRFVILSAPCSGSNTLARLLQSHPEVLCHHELFNPDGAYYALPLRYSEFAQAINPQQRDNSPIHFLERVWRKHLGKRWIGFRMTLKQNEAVFDAVLNDPGIKKIVLERQNGVRRYVSDLLQNKSCMLGSGSTSSGRVNVDLKELQVNILNNLSYYDELHTRLQLTQQNYLSLKYDQLVTPESKQAISKFMGLRFPLTHSQTPEQVSGDMKYKINNYQLLLDQCDDENLLKQITDNSKLG